MVPLKREDGEVWGVLDIDSDDLGSFDGYVEYNGSESEFRGQ